MSEKLVSKQVIAEKLSVSVRTVERLIKKGHIKGYRIGSQVRVKENDLKFYIQSKELANL